jgi:uncharacterized protein with PIN domain
LDESEVSVSRRSAALAGPRRSKAVEALSVPHTEVGGLARFLRMLGFDTLHENAFADEEIRRLAEPEGRIVLTRDC